MKTRISVLSGLARSTPILAALILAGLTLQAGAAPILVGKSQLARNQSTLPLETARTLVAAYNANHGPEVPNLPMPDSVTKAGRYGISKSTGKGKDVTPGSGYFLVKDNRTERNRNSVQLFYAANSQDATGELAGSGGGLGGSGGQSGAPNGGGATNPDQANPNTDNNTGSGYGKGNGVLEGFTPNGSEQHPRQVPDSGGTLALLGLAISALGMARHKLHA
ncbi:MAG: VPDSG-CTERM sorting domain-containing protein [Verrucomicrobiota bacterium]